ncbi:MAG TPA: hypothetical protein VEK07_10350 [Polyangiaceae bacterium]|nr:hypothetical protein [Polyangiaceae bacterium]
MTRTRVQRWVGDVRLVVRCAARPVTAEFDEHVAEARAMLDRTRVVLVSIVGDGADYQFDFEQRAKLYRAGLFAKPHAILAPRIRPEHVTSLKWLGAEIRSFSPDAFEDACDFLAIAPSERPSLRDAVANATHQLGHPALDLRSSHGVRVIAKAPSA